MRNILTAIISLSLLAMMPANAALRAIAPAQVCGYLDQLGLKTRGWKNLGGGETGCSSPYKELGSEFPLPNNIAYYVEGNQNSVSKAYLVLNVNVRKKEGFAKNTLFNAAKMLINKATGRPIPQVIRNAIFSGATVSAPIGDSLVSVLRQTWPNGRGYELHVEVQ